MCLQMYSCCLENIVLCVNSSESEITVFYIFRDAVYFFDCKQLQIQTRYKLKLQVTIRVVKNILAVHWKLDSHYAGECGKIKRGENMQGSAVFWQKSDCVGGLPKTCLNNTVQWAPDWSDRIHFSVYHERGGKK